MHSDGQAQPVTLHAKTIPFMLPQELTCDRLSRGRSDGREHTWVIGG